MVDKWSTSPLGSLAGLRAERIELSRRWEMRVLLSSPMLGRSLIVHIRIQSLENRLNRRDLPALTVRTATGDDLEEIARGMNSFYREHNLWSPVTPAELRGFLDTEVAGIRPYLLYVITRGDDLVGGLSMSDRTSLVRMKLTNSPFFVRMLGSLLGILPEDGSLQSLAVRRVWFREASCRQPDIYGSGCGTICVALAAAWASPMIRAISSLRCSRSLSGCPCSNIPALSRASS